MKTITVEQIHADFDNAQEVILAEAKQIIENTQVSNMSHVNHLRQTGFINSEVVKKAEGKLSLQVKSKEMAELVMHYKTKYPFLKFLTENKLDEICDKYKLIYAPVGNYKKDVPEKNLIEINQAKPLEESDARPLLWKVTKMSFFSGVPLRVRRWVLNTEFTENPGNDLWFTKKCPIPFDGWFYNSDGYTKEKIDKSGLFIAAPKSHFDLKGLSQKGIKGFFKTTVIKEVPDPIVFRYCKGGIQVLSKWGEEADDPQLTNELLN
jgi:hypothetical protein